MLRHKASIISKKVINVDKIVPGNIITFNYSGLNVSDTNPLVFVLPQLEEVRGGGKKARTAKIKKGGSFAGLNLHFLNSYSIDKLMEEQNFRKLKQWNLYNEAFRTYRLDKLNNLKLVEFRSRKQLIEEERQRIEEERKREKQKKVEQVEQEVLEDIGEESKEQPTKKQIEKQKEKEKKPKQPKKPKKTEIDKIIDKTIRKFKKKSKGDK